MTKTYQKNQPESIQKMFGSIAKRYDKTNALMSFNLHRIWNAGLVRLILQKRPQQVHQYLDLCCGTGEIAYTLLRKTQVDTEAFLIDFCQEMLDCAKSKLPLSSPQSHNVHFIQGDAQQIPLPAKSVDAVTIAYGIRNVKNPAQCVKEVLRVLRPGGIFAILELTQPTNPVMRIGHSLYLRTILPVIGKLTASNQEAYEYLSSSIQAFIPPADLQALLIQAGFVDTKRQSLTGGVATIVSGSKPE